MPKQKKVSELISFFNTVSDTNPNGIPKKKKKRKPKTVKDMARQFEKIDETPKSESEVETTEKPVEKPRPVEQSKKIKKPKPAKKKEESEELDDLEKELLALS